MKALNDWWWAELLNLSELSNILESFTSLNFQSFASFKFENSETWNFRLPQTKA